MLGIDYLGRLPATKICGVSQCMCERIKIVTVGTQQIESASESRVGNPTVNAIISSS